MNHSPDKRQQFAEGSGANGSLPPLILQSWQRSRAAGVDPGAEHLLRNRLADQELQGRLWANAGLMTVARPHLELAVACLAEVPHAICLTDREGVVLYATGTLPGREDLGLLAGGNWSEERVGTNALGTALQTRQSVAILGPEHFHKSCHDLAGVAAPVNDPPAGVLGAVGILTRHKDGSRQRLELANLVARTVEREWADRQRKETVQSQEEFLAQLVHELRNPMATLLNALHLIRLSEKDPSALAGAREVAERQVRQLAGLLDDLLDIARIAGGRVHLQKERVEVEGIIQEAVAASRPLLDARRHQLTVLLPPEPLALAADRRRLVQVLTHLLANSAKYTETGGHIWIAAERAGDEVLLSVRDTGVGLPVDLLPRAFDLYLGKGVGVQGGLRIGLNLARGLVELHGGSIVALSDGSGEGSEFVVRLPAPRGEEPGGRLAAAGAPATAKLSLRVLVVDDDIDGADSLEKLLSLWQHQVQTVHEGFGALDVARTWRPEVVLLDLGLPGGLDGVEVARQLREDVGLTKAVIIAMTGFGQAEDFHDLAQAGFDHHLIKPVDPGSLQRLLAGLEKAREGEMRR